MVANNDNKADKFSIAYAQLRQLAASYLSNEPADHSLSPTSVVHEAWTRLQPIQSPPDKKIREDFYMVFAREMQRVLIEYARRKRRRETLLKSGIVEKQIIAQESPSHLSQRLDVFTEELQDLDPLDLETALKRFAAAYPDKAKLVRLRFFVGCSLSECAEMMQICERTADRYWSFARAWLTRELRCSRP